MCDRGVMLVSNLDLHAYDLFPRAAATELELHLLLGAGGGASYQSAVGRIVFTADRVTPHMVRQLAAFLAGAHSDRFDSVHGCGLVLGGSGRGVLLVGPHGSGKSTLARSVGEARLLDDDLLVVDRTRMYPVGLGGDAAPRGDRVDLVCCLDPTLPGGEYQEIPGGVPREATVHDAFPEELRAAYLALPQLLLQAPVCRLGTGGAVDRTASVIDQICGGS